MFSSRRYSPRYKSRQYYKKKNINRKFSPAVYKNNIPTYYQQKGRIIQTSPLHLYSVPRQLPSSETLKEMYETLIKVNYPNVGPQPTPPPSLPLQPYVSQFSLNSQQCYALENHKITPLMLEYLVETYGNLTPLPEGWAYRFELFTISMSHRIPQNSTSIAQYHIDLCNPILSNMNNPVQIVIKSVTTSGGTTGVSAAWLCSFIPIEENYGRIPRCTYSTGSITVSNLTLATNDSEVNDNGWYPIISSDGLPENNYLDFVLNSGEFPPELLLLFTVLCTPVQL